jgi:hypothetical protein
MVCLAFEAKERGGGETPLGFEAGGRGWPFRLMIEVREGRGSRKSGRPARERGGKGVIRLAYEAREGGE